MLKDLKIFLWLMKAGTLVNLYYLGRTFTPPLASTNAHLLLPAQVFFVVSAFRCLFPVRYEGNIVFHDSPLSSIFLTRLFATFSEVALIYLLAHVIQFRNAGQFGWINALSLFMIVQVTISQLFVWGAILTRRALLYFYEELGWAIIFAANTVASAYLFWSVGKAGSGEFLLRLNLLFGVVYLPWQLTLFHG